MTNGYNYNATIWMHGTLSNETGLINFSRSSNFTEEDSTLMMAAVSDGLATKMDVVTETYGGDKVGPGISPELEYYLKGVALPTLGLIGVLGNTMNLIVLSSRYKRREVDVLEKGALLGLIALAFSDLCFCLGLLPQAFFYKSKALFYKRGLWLYYQMYAFYYENVFIKTSTGLTLLVGVARYMGICHPLRLNAQLFIGLKGIKIAIASIYTFWIVVLIPMWWNYTVTEWKVDNETALYLDLGPVLKNRHVKLTFTYLWTCLGYFIPVTILVYCNIRLILALWESVRLRERSVRSRSIASRDYTVRITLTLVFLILSFIMLASPSEILHFYADVVHADTYESFEMAIVCTNILQATNFAFHFLLYCAVNSSFRRAVVQVFLTRRSCCKKNRTPQKTPLVKNYGRLCRTEKKKSHSSTSKSIESFL